VLSVDQSWDENAITWNNAPQAHENLDGTWILPVSDTPPYPGIPYNWDISRAVAEAYAAGEPVRLAVYSSNSSLSNGRYFHSSDVEDLNAGGRPTLRVAWGVPQATLLAAVWPTSAAQGQTVTYTLSILGSGSAMTLTDSLPSSVSAPLSAHATTGSVVYHSASHQVDWQGTSAAGNPMTITFPVTVLVSSLQLIVNTAMLTDTLAGSMTSAATFIANAYQVYLPISRK
jgi:hypothetical protein